MAQASAPADLAPLLPLLVAKSRVPLLPVCHIPRPERVARLYAAATSQRLVLIRAGGLAGKTTLLAELLHTAISAPCVWYNVDELDTSARGLVEGLAVAILGQIPGGDELHILAAIVAALMHDPAPMLLILDDCHRSSAVSAVGDRLLRYLPTHVHLVLSGRAETPLTALHYALLDQGQACLCSTSDLRLDTAERERFIQASGHTGGWWAVDYRPGGQAVVQQRLRAGILPDLAPPLREVLEVLAIVPSATAGLLAAATHMPADDVASRLITLARDTILLEGTDTQSYRLTEAAHDATLQALDPARRDHYRLAVATALEAIDLCEAARLFAEGGAFARAVAAANRAGRAAWHQHQATAERLEHLLPPVWFRQAVPVALLLAAHRLVRDGANAVHAAVRRIRPQTAVDQVDRLRILGLCAFARGRPWSLDRVIAATTWLADAPNPHVTPTVRSYALTTVGNLLLLAGDVRRGHRALGRALDLLDVAEDHDPSAFGIRLQATQALALAQRRLGAFEDAARLYDTAASLAQAGNRIGQALEIANNRAVLLQQLGRYRESEEHLRLALASPWAGDIGLRGTLLASLADALAAQGRPAEAIRTAYEALTEVPPQDTYGIRTYLHASLALILAASGQPAAARSELAQAPPAHPVALLAKAVLADPGHPGTRELFHTAITAAGTDVPLRALGAAYMARFAQATGDHATATRLTTSLITDPAYPLTPREADILGDLTHRSPRHSGQLPAPASSTPVVIRFFGGPVAYVDGKLLGKQGWRYAKASDLFWYALAHGSRGFTREQACADLFSDMDGVKGGRSLRNVLYELRRLLRTQCGLEDVLVPQGDHLHLQPEELSRVCECDLDLLRALLVRLRGGTLEPVADLVGLIEQPYLADLEGDWPRPFRTYWDSEAIRALDLAIGLTYRAGRQQEALTLLLRQRQFCPDDPALTRRIMLLAHEMGDSGTLRAAYLEHCRSAREELDAPPDHDVVALYRKLQLSHAQGA